MIAYVKATALRDLQQRLVLRWSFLMHLAGTVVSLGVFFLIDRFQGQLFGARLAEAMAPLHTSYFGYVALGLAVSTLANMGLGGVLGQMGVERGNRTLEYLMSSPVSLRRWAAATGFCHLARAFFEAFVIFALAILVLRLRVPGFNAFAVAAVVAIAAVPLWCLSLLTLSASLVFRRGNPLGFLLGTSFELLGGVYAPQSVLPSWLSRLSELLPITPALRAIQGLVYQGASLSTVLPDVQQLVVLGVVYLPLALLVVQKSDEHCRHRGYYSLQ